MSKRKQLLEMDGHEEESDKRYKCDIIRTSVGCEQPETEQNHCPENETTKECAVPDCVNPAIRKWCNDHTSKDQCQTTNCSKRAVYGVPGGGLRMCKKHKTDEMQSRSILCDMCNKAASYGHVDEKETRCSGHREDKMEQKKMSNAQKIKSAAKAPGTKGTKPNLGTTNLYQQVDLEASQTLFGLDELQICNMTLSSNKSLVWKCNGSDHQWIMAVCNRGKATSCATCDGRHAPPLTEHYSYDEIDWSGECTKTFSVDEVNQLTQGSGKSLSYICEKGHTYDAIIRNRTNGSGCNVCAGHGVRGTLSLLSTVSAIYEEIDWETNLQHGINKTKIDSLTFGSNDAIHWKCKRGHRWNAKVNTRQRSNCSSCAGQHGIKLKDTLWYDYVDIEMSIRRGVSPDRLDNITLGAQDKLAWICSKTCSCSEHVWFVNISDRQRFGCTFCTGKKTCSCSSLQARFPEIAKQMHPTLNSKSANCIAPFSNDYIYWVCEDKDDHVWNTTVNSRTYNNSGCPKCTKWKQEHLAGTILNELKLDYTVQYKFPKQRYGPFDILVYATSDTQQFLWELDGIQHFEGVTFGSKSVTKEEAFIDQRRRDKVKDAIVFFNNSLLLRSPYTHSTKEQLAADLRHFMNTIRFFTDKVRGFIMCTDAELYGTQKDG